MANSFSISAMAPFQSDFPINVWTFSAIVAFTVANVTSLAVVVAMKQIPNRKH
jgi:hypothetical protein